MGDDRPPAYWEDETLVIRASSLGGPICQLVAAGQGNDILPPPPWLQKAFDAGNHWEGPVLEELRRRGWREAKGQEDAAQAEHDYPIVPGIVIRFHPDDVLLPVGDEVPTSREPLNFPEGPVIVEAKALSAANYEIATRDGAECLPYAYDWQLSAMMLGLRLPAVWVTVDKSAKGRPVPDDKEELIPGMSDEIAVCASLHAQWVAHPPIPKATIVKRVLLIRKLIQSGELPTDPAHHGANPCRFLYLCPTAAEQKDTVRLLGERADEMVRWARFYEQQKEIERLAKERKDEARGQLIEMLGEDSRVAADGYVVRRDEVTSSRVNRKAIERDNGGAVPEGWLAESTSTRLTVEGPGAPA
jgi:hypothetical protein